jgi:hypothetical protein
MVTVLLSLLHLTQQPVERDGGIVGTEHLAQSQANTT